MDIRKTIDTTVINKEAFALSMIECKETAYHLAYHLGRYEKAIRIMNHVEGGCMSFTSVNNSMSKEEAEESYKQACWKAMRSFLIHSGEFKKRGYCNILAKKIDIHDFAEVEHVLDAILAVQAEIFAKS